MHINVHRYLFVYISWILYIDSFRYTNALDYQTKISVTISMTTCKGNGWNIGYAQKQSEDDSNKKTFLDVLLIAFKNNKNLYGYLVRSWLPDINEIDKSKEGGVKRLVICLKVWKTCVLN